MWNARLIRRLLPGIQWPLRSEYSLAPDTPAGGPCTADNPWQRPDPEHQVTHHLNPEKLRQHRKYNNRVSLTGT